ncbi:hypothetical protein Tco_0621489 [Tanacetum coccineum]
MDQEIHGVRGNFQASSDSPSDSKKMVFGFEVNQIYSEERCEMVGYVNDSLGYMLGHNTDVMPDTRRIPFIGDSSSTIPDVSKLDTNFLVEEFKGGMTHLNRGTGASNPMVNIDVEGGRNNLKRGTGASNPMVNVEPKPNYRSTRALPSYLNSRSVTTPS